MNTSINGTTRPAYRGLKLFNLIAALILILTAFGTAASTPAVATRVQPVLLQMAAETPLQLVDIIVQKTVSDASVEAQVAALGGKITKDLRIIHAFAAEMPAQAAVDLARSSGVRWVSLDAPMSTAAAASQRFTTWATANGTVVKNSFARNALMADSSLGPNGTFGHGAMAKGAFTGFAGQAAPGNAIVKVELVLRAFVPARLQAGADPIIVTWVNGVKGKARLLDHHALDTHVGAGNAGRVYLDITRTRNWQWADFEGDLQVVIDQSRFPRNSTIYYDAIGLRVTSAPGTDTSLDRLASSSTGVTDLNMLADSSISGSTVDGSAQVNVYNQVIGATQLWNTTNRLQGGYVTVAVVDSGIYQTPDIAYRIRVNVNFNSSDHNAPDLYGHGTFVAGIVGGNGSQSNGKFIGVAPKATMLNVRVADDQGMLYESDLIDALQWVCNNRAIYGIRVVNLSLNSSIAQSYDTSPLDAAVEIVWFNKIVVVVSAGNNGSSTLYPPANDPFVITVGATDDHGTIGTSDDTLATFSAHGTTESGLVKPDLVAPGRLIIGLLPQNDQLSIGKAHPANRVDATYFMMSGTSVSAPMVSGAVALLLQDEPYLTPDQVKYRLMATADKDWPGYDPSEAGAGYLDIYSAVYSTTTRSANTGILASQLLSTGSNPIVWNSVGWNSVGWNSVGWNSVGWNSVGWNSVGWNSDYWGP